jgi:alpha-1,2-mannosyltransferase
VDRPACVERLSRWERLGLVCFVVAVVLFGCLVELRTTFLSRRMGDLNCFLRPAWAIRTGGDIYQILDDCGWHYNYPPLFAILMTPLADAPAGADRTGMLPYAVSIAIWYVLSVIFLAVGVHWLASALEEQSADPRVRQQPAGCRRWWALRLLPVLACLGPIGHTLMRGQCNLLVLMCLCGMIAALLRRQSYRAGWWLAWPICIKVYPVFLLLYPVVRRDWRFLTGSAAGLFLGLILIPAAVLGPQRTWDYYVEYVQVTLAPGLGVGHDLSRSGELTHITSTDSQSLLAALHNSLHPNRTTRPADASPRLRQVAALLGGLLTLITLWAARRRQLLAGAEVPLFLGALILNMLLLCPVCHLHYFSLAVPVVMGLVASSWGDRLSPHLDRSLGLLLLANIVIYILPNLPRLMVLRELGFAVYGGLLLWGTAVVVLRRGGRDDGACRQGAQPKQAAA